MTKLTVAFRHSANAPKNDILNAIKITTYIYIRCSSLTHNIVISPHLAEINHWFSVTNLGVLLNASTKILTKFMSTRYLRFVCPCIIVQFK
jgi:hypothetical protein